LGAGLLVPQLLAGIMLLILQLWLITGCPSTPLVLGSTARRFNVTTSHAILVVAGADVTAELGNCPKSKNQSCTCASYSST
jgi:hypothetical protein